MGSLHRQPVDIQLHPSGVVLCSISVPATPASLSAHGQAQESAEADSRRKTRAMTANGRMTGVAAVLPLSVACGTGFALRARSCRRRSFPSAFHCPLWGTVGGTLREDRGAREQGAARVAWIFATRGQWTTRAEQGTPACLLLAGCSPNGRLCTRLTLLLYQPNCLFARWRLRRPTPQREANIGSVLA
jgi:hypothetical protein